MVQLADFINLYAYGYCYPSYLLCFGFRITFVSLQLSLPLNITTDQAKRLESSVEI